MGYELATIVAIVVGPVAAVLITLWHQDRAQKTQAKRQVFNVLMTNRRTFPPTREWVNALNLIDVIFAGDKAVLDLWHRLYEIVCTVPLPEEQFRHTHLDLLQQMARSLGYSELKQTDIDKFYAPQIHGDMAARGAALQDEYLQFVRNMNAVAAQAKIGAPQQVAGPQPEHPKPAAK